MLLSGITRGLFMNPGKVLCKINPAKQEEILEFVCRGLGDKPFEYKPCINFGVWLDDKLIAGIILNDIRPNRDVWMTIYSENKRWCTRNVLQTVFSFIFMVIKAERASIFVSKDNEASNNLVKRLGFVCEGLLRRYRDDGQDCFVYGMLKNECKWSGKK